MEFSMNEQQVPMVMRIVKLITYLIRRDYKQGQECTPESSNAFTEGN